MEPIVDQYAVLSENFQFLEVKFSIYLNRHVFVMQGPITATFLIFQSANLLCIEPLNNSQGPLTATFLIFQSVDLLYTEPLYNSHLLKTATFLIFQCANLLCIKPLNKSHIPI